MSIGVFVCFSWAFIGFFNKLSSFILYFTPAEIGAIFAYMMAFALLESLGVTAVLTCLSAILPSNWLKNGFGYKGFVILLIGTIDAILFQKFLDTRFPSALMLILSSILPIALTVIVLGILNSIPKAQNILTSIQDRFLIMLFVYVPIGLICIIAVTFRNLL